MAIPTAQIDPDDIGYNTTSNPSLNALVDQRYSRRQALFGGASAMTMAVFGGALLTACGEDNDDDTTAPTVSAGAAATVSAGRVVTLQGSATDEVGLGNVAWTQSSGPTVTLSGASTNTATFLAPGVATDTPLNFRFTARDAAGNESSATTVVTVTPAQLGFAAVAKNRNDMVTIPAGYTLQVINRLGDPVLPGVAEYANNGTDTNFAGRIGDHGDAINYYGLNAAGTARDDLSSTRGLLVQNHENLNQVYLHPNGPTSVGGVRPESEVIKEIEAHGVSVVEVQQGANGAWTMNVNGSFQRRITPNTPTAFAGPARGSAYLRTPFSSDGTSGRGTINNCANGRTPWGTNLTCEENWAGYFRRSGDDANRTVRELTSLRRYGVTSSTGNYSWSTVVPAEGGNTTFRRWDARATAGGSATSDFRNEPNQFGWVVEINPYDRTAMPVKRTSIGRFGHEGAWFGKVTVGKKIAVYSGDDSRNEYLYKYVSNESWVAADAEAANPIAVGDKYLNNGTLYVARFNADGTGTWLPLVAGQVPPRAAQGTVPAYSFEDQADILVNTRLAADAVGATPMDRPEWTATNQVTGEIYLTLTNNAAGNKPFGAENAANPRFFNDPQGTSAQSGNPNGHIVRLRENGDDGAATGFVWDIYLFGATSDNLGNPNVNISGLTAENDFSSPDGLWFSRPTNPAGQGKPLLWLQTDDSAYTDVTNNQMLAALPGTVGDGGARMVTNTGTNGTTNTVSTYAGMAATSATLRRFLVGPIGCEITGVDSTPDGRTLFVGIQHPGETSSATVPDPLPSNWPASQTGPAPTSRPRGAVAVISKADGGVVGL
jgi:secreted PhoX family phosphatase